MRRRQVLGMEDSSRCLDYRHRQVHVAQQLRFHKAMYGGFYLAPPKAGSVGDVDLDDHVEVVLAQHVRRYPATTVELPDITTGTPNPRKVPTRRPVALLFTNDQGLPIHDQRWSDMWQGWRRAGRISAGETEDFAYLLVDENQRLAWQQQLVNGYTVTSRIEDALQDHVLADTAQGRIATRSDADNWRIRTLAHHQGHHDISSRGS